MDWAPGVGRVQGKEVAGRLGAEPDGTERELDCMPSPADGMSMPEPG